MSEIFLKAVNMSIAAGWLLLIVILFRMVFKKSPKWIHCLLWAFVALRLLCPITLQSPLSMLPSAETVNPEILKDESEPIFKTGFAAVNSYVNPIIWDVAKPSDEKAEENGSLPTQNEEESESVFVKPMFIVSVAWCIGTAVMLLYAIVSYLRIKKKVSTAVCMKDNIWQSEAVSTPFILGFFRARIYLPFGMKEEELEAVLAHEKAHLQRKDHLIKPLSFILLSVYWFNPLMWLAYILLSRDIEYACDEKAIAHFDVTNGAAKAMLGGYI